MFLYTFTHCHELCIHCLHHSLQDGFTPLIIASQEGHKDIVEVVLNHGAEVDLPVKVIVLVITIIISGSLTLSLRLVFSLVTCGIKNGSEIVVYMYVCDSMHSLQAADVCGECFCAHCHELCIHFLHHSLQTGTTPLILASLEGHKDIVEVLLNHGAEVNLPDKVSVFVRYSYLNFHAV